MLQIKKKLHSPMGRDVIWTFSVQMLVMLCGFIITKILSNRLSIDDFGLYNMIKRSAGVLSFVILAGTGIAIPRYLPIFRNQKEPFSCISFSQATLLMVLAIAVIVSPYSTHSHLQQLHFYMPIFGEQTNSASSTSHKLLFSSAVSFHCFYFLS